jgi:hypothetical protein
MLRRRFLTAAAVAAIAVLYPGSRADAGFQVTMKGPSGTTVTVVDGGGGSDLVADGIINLATVGPLDGYTFLATLAMTNTPAGPALAFVDADSTVVGSGGAGGTIQLIASANGFNLPVVPPPLVATSGATFQVGGGTAGGNTFDVSYGAAIDTANGLSTSLVGTPVGSGSQSGISASSGNVALSDTEVINTLSGPYAINFALFAKLNNNGANSINLDGTVNLQPQAVVPAPSGLVLLGTAVPVFGLLRRRLRRNATPAV